MPRRRWLPANVTEYTDRHGKPRYRWRKAGYPAHNFSSAATPGTPEFMAELAAAQAAAPIVIRPGLGTGTPRRPAPVQGSIAHLCQLWFASPRFLDLTDATQAAYRRPLERFCERHGTKPAAALHAAHIDALLGQMKDRPGAANNLRKALGRIFAYAVKLRWRTDNPVPHSDPFKAGPGFHCWSEEEIAQFCAHWPVGSKPRLALELGLNTSARRCDAVRLGRRHMVDGRFEFTHAKGGKPVSIPILPECQAAIDAMPVRGITGTLLITDYGKPFTTNGFGNWFRQRCNEAGLPHCTFHGLRKAISRRMAESGSTSLQGRAITGQRRDETFEYYAQAASASRMADAALANLADASLANRTKG